MRQHDLPRLDRVERRPQRHDHRRGRREERQDPGEQAVRVLGDEQDRGQVARRRDVIVTGIEALDASSIRDASDPRKPIAVE